MAGAPPRRRLFRKYALLVIALVGTALLINSGFDLWFSYQENKAALIRIQQEKAEAAARRVEEFVGEIERQIGWTTHAQWAAGPLDQRRQDYFRLLRQVPSITELTQLDREGREQLTVSRLKMDVIGPAEDFSKSPAFSQAKARRIWFSPVYFRKESEPYMTVGMAREGRNAGVTVAEINLKLIWDVITALKIGQSGYAYVVDERGRLIAHPDISLVLRDTDLSKLPQVSEAMAPAPGSHGDTPAATVAKSIGGRTVLTAHAAIAPVGWLVFVEVPLSEAFAPLYGAVLRTLVLLAFGLIAATLVALVLARRMTGPIRAIEAGAERIGRGELDRRIEVRTGDELEALAEQFNRMGADLQKSYAELEQRVADRTAELSESLDQQTATAEVLGVINSSPGDLTPVFDAMLAKAVDLCDAAHGVLRTFDGKFFHLAAMHGEPDAVERLKQLGPIELGSVRADDMLGPIVHGESIVHIADVREIDTYRNNPVARERAEVLKQRTWLAVALRKDGVLLGVIMTYRTVVRPFSEKQIALLQNFAAQAVIAIENARLITETREALDQQTATAEVLGVINSSPGDLAPVFDAIAQSAKSLCDAASGSVFQFDGSLIHLVAHCGWTADELAAVQRLFPIPPGRGSVTARAILTGAVVHVADMTADPEFAYQSLTLSGLHTALSVPMLRDGTPLGAISVNRSEIAPFTDKQIALLQNFAAQAVIAIENARLITETREALDQQTATAEVLGVINSSPGDLAPVFDAMLEKATTLCEAAFGILRTWDGERFHLNAVHGEAGFREWARRVGPIQPNRDDSPLGRILRGEPFVSFVDALGEEAYQTSPGYRALVDASGIRSAITVALRKDAVLLGTITVYRQEVRPFSDKQIALLQNFAAQAVIAMENARLITETREALEQQTATAEVLGVINSSPGDLTPVFEAMLEKAHRLCGVTHGVLVSYDGDSLRAVATHGLDEPLAELLHQPFRPLPNSPHARMIHDRAVIHIPDLASETLWERDDPKRIGTVKQGVRTMLFVPLCKEDKLLGYFSANRQEVRPFTDKQIALLQNFAAQAVIAMENARLITETQEALEQQTATAEVLGVINSSPGDLAPVFDAMLEKATELCDAPVGTLWLFDGEHINPVATRGVPEELAEFLRSGPRKPNPVQQRQLRGEGTIHLADLRATALYRDGDPLARAVVDLGNIQTVLSVPLRREDRVLGLFGVYRQEIRPFSDKQIALIDNFAAQAVIAMENARLITETREALEQQTATADVLGVINSSPGDLKPVFDAILEKAHTLCESTHGALATFDGECFRAVATHGLPDEFVDLLSLPYPPYSGSLEERLVLGDEFVHVPDNAVMEALPDNPISRAAVDLTAVRTVLLLPLRKDDTLLGYISAHRKEVRPFTDKQIALLQNFAAQAVIAIENARLLGELHERTDDLARSVEELKVLGEVGQAVSSTLDLHSVLVTILNRSIALAGAEAGVIFRYSRAERAFRFVEAVGWDEALVEQVRDLNVGESMTALGDAVANRAPFQIPDLQRRPSNPLRDSSLAAGFRSVLIVPLVGADRIMGATILQRRTVGEFPEATIRLMQALASQSVLAIQNARLFREIADKSEQLAEASRHKSQFLANMSHELRTPLNAVLGYTELMADGIYGELPPRAAGVLERVQNNGRHLLALINDVLDLAKIEAGQLAMTLEDYAMPDVVQSVVSATEGLANTKGLRFTADIAPGLPPGRGDARRLSQVLLNLVGNAVKFTDVGEVAIGARAEHGRFILTVRDTGPGIAAADQGKIFEEFQQVDNSNTRKKGGTGLGLAISKRMVEMQGGTISVDSELGHGATFRVILPVRVEEAADELPNELNRELLGAAK